MKRALLVILMAMFAGCATPSDPTERSRQNADKQETLQHLKDIEMQQRG